MLMSKNVNNDVSKDSPIVSYAPKWRGCSILGERQLGVFPEGEGRGGEQRNSAD